MRAGQGWAQRPVHNDTVEFGPDRTQELTVQQVLTDAKSAPVAGTHAAELGMAAETHTHKQEEEIRIIYMMHDHETCHPKVPLQRWDFLHFYSHHLRKTKPKKAEMEEFKEAKSGEQHSC